MFALMLAGGLVFLAGWKCPVWWVLGIPCPGCRFTRACLALAAGDFSYSIAQHAMVLPTAAAALLWLFCTRHRTGILLVWSGLMMAYWLWRMAFVFPAWPMEPNPSALLQVILRGGI